MERCSVPCPWGTCDTAPCSRVRPPPALGITEQARREATGSGGVMCKAGETHGGEKGSPSPSVFISSCRCSLSSPWGWGRAGGVQGLWGDGCHPEGHRQLAPLQDSITALLSPRQPLSDPQPARGTRGRRFGCSASFWRWERRDTDTQGAAQPGSCWAWAHQPRKGPCPRQGWGETLCQPLSGGCPQPRVQPKGLSAPSDMWQQGPLCHTHKGVY